VGSNRGNLECEDYPDQHHVACHIEIPIFFIETEPVWRVGKICDNAGYLKRLNLTSKDVFDFSTFAFTYYTGVRKHYLYKLICNYPVHF